jgi:purine-binding chemotaxis protein CheW
MGQSFIVAGLRGYRYGFPAVAVREIVWLPALTCFDELPDYIAGAFDLRGRVVPVLDLGLRFGRVPHPRQATDQVVVIDQGDLRLGILVDELFDVLNTDDGAVEPADRYQLPGGQARFVGGVLRQDDKLVMVLDVPALLAEAPDLAPIAPSSALEPLPEDLLQRRARALAKVPRESASDRFARYALVRLGGELFGLALAQVREFAHVQGQAPVPQAPAHVAGVMNLRGDLLTLVDIRGTLGVAAPAAAELVVIELDGQRFGLLAESVEEVLEVAPEQIGPNPRAQRVETEPFCSGVAWVGDWIFSVLELPLLVQALGRTTAPGA